MNYDILTLGGIFSDTLGRSEGAVDTLLTRRATFEHSGAPYFGSRASIATTGDWQPHEVVCACRTAFCFACGVEYLSDEATDGNVLPDFT